MKYVVTDMPRDGALRSVAAQWSFRSVVFGSVRSL